MCFGEVWINTGCTLKSSFGHLLRAKLLANAFGAVFTTRRAKALSTDKKQFYVLYSNQEYFIEYFMVLFHMAPTVVHWLQ